MEDMIMSFEKTNAPGLVKDPKKGLVINTNVGEYENILAARKKKSCDEELKMAVKELQNQMIEVKKAVAKLLNKYD